MIPEIVEEIQAYTRQVEEGRPPCDRSQCPGCGEEPTSFCLHDRRGRIFLVVVERVVRTLRSLIARWRCPRCGKRFISYPPFALPRKRYIRPEILSRSERYLKDDRATYRSVVRCGGLRIFYDKGDPDEIDERSLAPSTPHRWITALSRFPRTLREALEMIRAKDPRSSIFRDALLFPPRKYQSLERKLRLQAALRLLHADREYRRLFGRSVFPELATGAGFG